MWDKYRLELAWQDKSHHSRSWGKTNSVTSSRWSSVMNSYQACYCAIVSPHYLITSLLKRTLASMAYVYMVLKPLSRSSWRTCNTMLSVVGPRLVQQQFARSLMYLTSPAGIAITHTAEMQRRLNAALPTIVAGPSAPLAYMTQKLQVMWISRKLY